MIKVSSESAKPPRSAAALAAALIDVRGYTKSVCAHLDAMQRDFPCAPGTNPLAWELGHIGWFQEFWCRRYAPDDLAATRMPSRLATADAWWNSSTVPHATRWSLPLPDAAGIDAWLDATLVDTLDGLAHSRDGERYFFELALYHEDMHVEALLMILQSLALPWPPAYRGKSAHPSVPLPEAVDFHFAGGVLQLGAQRTAPAPRFVFDNEKWSHPVAVAPFSMAATCVTNAQMASFVAAGGYAHPEWWSPDGWAWRTATDVQHPAHWRRSAGGWEQRHFAEWMPLALAQPVMHVNAFEAEAWCRYANRRLPSEAEWEFAARHAPLQVNGVLDLASSAPLAATTDHAMSHLLGNVWEWTASTFMPFPGFAADPYADYSAPWFGDHRVLRGGSFASRSRLVHPGFRNFYRPERTDPFAGFRTCAVQHTC
ncbi:MAG: selenoneine synthase SenA [Casimicrobiaceae bacterium]